MREAPLNFLGELRFAIQIIRSGKGLSAPAENLREVVDNFLGDVWA